MRICTSSWSWFSKFKPALCFGVLFSHPLGFSSSILTNDFHSYTWKTHLPSEKTIWRFREKYRNILQLEPFPLIISLTNWSERRAVYYQRTWKLFQLCNHCRDARCLFLHDARMLPSMLGVSILHMSHQAISCAVTDIAIVLSLVAESNVSMLLLPVCMQMKQNTQESLSRAAWTAERRLWPQGVLGPPNGGNQR